MIELDEITGRLEAVEGLDWSTRRKLFEEEKYGDFHEVGPVLVPTDLHADGYWVSPEDKAWAVQSAAVAEFLQHAAGDMRLLLDRLGEQP